MITVRIFFLDGTDDIKCCNDLSEICLDNVDRIKIIRQDTENKFSMVG